MLLAASVLAWCTCLSAQSADPYFVVETGNVDDLEVSSGGEFLFVVEYPHVSVYDLVGRDLASKITLRSGASWFTGCVAASEDGKVLAYLDDEVLDLYDTESGDLLRRVPHELGGRSLGDRLVLLGRDARVALVWRRFGGGDLFVFEESTSLFRDLGKATAVAGRGGKLAIGRTTREDGWSLSHTVEVRPLTGLGGTAGAVRELDAPVLDLTFSPDGREVLLQALGGEAWDGSLWRVLDSETLRDTVAPQDDSRLVRSGFLVYSPLQAGWSGKTPVVLYHSQEQGSAAVASLGDGRVLFTVEGLEGPMGLSADGRWLAGVFRRSLVHAYETRSLGAASQELGVGLARPRLAPQLYTDFSEIAMSHDGGVMAAADVDGNLSLFETVTGRQLGRMYDVFPGWGGGSISLSATEPLVLVGFADGSGAVWDVAELTLKGRLNRWEYGGGEVLRAFVGRDSEVLTCDREQCQVTALWSPETARLLTLPPKPDGTRYEQLGASVAPSEEGVALALGQAGVGWLSLKGKPEASVVGVGRRRRAVVKKVLALEDEKVAAVTSDDEIALVDVSIGRVTKLIGLNGTIDAVGRLGHDELLVALFRGESPDAPELDMLTLSATDLSTLEKTSLPWAHDHRYQSFSAARDGGRLAYLARPPIGLGRGIAGWIEVANSNGPAGGVLGEGLATVAPVSTVSFSLDGNLLLTDNNVEATVWDLRRGQVVEQIQHSEQEVFLGSLRQVAFQRGGGVVFLTGATAPFGVAERERFPERGIGTWSTRKGLRAETIHPLVHYGRGVGLSRDGTRVAFGVYDNWPYFRLARLEDQGAPGQGLFEWRISVEREGVRRVSFDLHGNRTFLDRGKLGLEALEGPDAESIWWRRDIEADVLREVLTSTDLGAVIVHAKREGAPDQLLVLDAETGITRFEQSLSFSPGERSVPVQSDSGVHALARMSPDRSAVEVVSLRDGSVLGDANLGVSDIYFVVANRSGSLWLVVGRSAAVLWEPLSGARRVLDDVRPGWSKAVGFSEQGVLAVGADDGTIHLWDVSGGAAESRYMARLLAFQEGSWAVVRSDGRYDASDPADFSGLSWVHPDEPTKAVPLAVFYREYYEPRLLARLLAGEEFGSLPFIAGLDRRQPKVEIVSVETADDYHVDVVVAVSVSGNAVAADLKLFRGGALVGIDELVGGVAGRTRSVVFKDVAIPTSGDTVVEFSAYAFNGDGIKGETSRFLHRRPEVQPRSRRAFVIGVGVNAYEDESWDLRYAAEDARVGVDFMARHIESARVFDEVHSVLLVSERDDGGAMVGSASRAALLAVLDVLGGGGANPAVLEAIPGAASLSEVSPDDLVYLSFSGHGLGGENGRFHLFLADTAGAEPRTVDDTLLSRTLGSDVLAAYLHRIDAGAIVVVLDACNAAASVESTGFKPGPMGSRGLGQLAYDKAMRILAASQAEGVALESGEIGHGLLTFAMIHEGLAGGWADRAPVDGSVEFSELLSFGVDRVPLLYEDVRSGHFSQQGRSADAVFAPSEEVWTPVQQPKLFDFSRGGRDLRLPVDTMSTKERTWGADGLGRGADPSPAARSAHGAVGTFSDELRSGSSGPEIVVIPPGSFRMGCISGVACYDWEGSPHQVRIPRALGVSKYEVTFEEWDACVSAGGCSHRPDDEGWGRGRRPVINVSWEDAQDYVRWLSQETGGEYRLLSESEWEYAARSGTTTAYSWGGEIGSGRANCLDCGSQWDAEQTAPVGSFSPNVWGLHDVHGNVLEWVQDCRNDSYAGAPSDGRAWTEGGCSSRVLRGGAWDFESRSLRSAFRGWSSVDRRNFSFGFRVARTLTP